MTQPAQSHLTTMVGQEEGMSVHRDQVIIDAKVTEPRTGIINGERAGVLAGSKQSRGGGANGENMHTEAQVISKPQGPAPYGQGFVGARTKGFETGKEGHRQPFYFGMSPPDKDQPPSLPTAVGKVRDNETLSQPFRTQPRHRVSKDREE